MRQTGRSPPQPDPMDDQSILSRFDFVQIDYDIVLPRIKWCWILHEKISLIRLRYRYRSKLKRTRLKNKNVNSNNSSSTILFRFKNRSSAAAAVDSERFDTRRRNRCEYSVSSSSSCSTNKTLASILRLLALYFVCFSTTANGLAHTRTIVSTDKAAAGIKTDGKSK